VCGFGGGEGQSLTKAWSTPARRSHPEKASRDHGARWQGRIGQQLWGICPSILRPMPYLLYTIYIPSICITISESKMYVIIFFLRDHDTRFSLGFLLPALHSAQGDLYNTYQPREQQK
jgi:hypothetical protein